MGGGPVSDKSTALVPTNLGDVMRLSAELAKSALLPQELRGKTADVLATILAGEELGIKPMAALRSIHIIKGKPVLSADGMVAVVLGSGLAEYFTCTESTGAVATYETKRRGSPTPQRMSFTIDEAKAAGLASGDNWKRYGAAMLRARAKAALARDVYPDALAGVYEEGEAREFSGPTPVKFEAPSEPAIDAEYSQEEQVIHPALTDEQLTWWKQKLQLAASVSPDALRELITGEMAEMTEAQRVLLRPAVNAAKRAAADRYADRLKAQAQSVGPGVEPAAGGEVDESVGRDDVVA